ncbi:hypothetical protein TCSYLVIO_007025 [Trypanosoma cruzi]|uniref:Uncharacterized protein n=2 Tax=Trypanosoma cruzi TaxID=5693 RepID=V5D6Y9_TRYCR|nr:hypothetical protein TCSYLVIO_007025 [Trypanosoma cruzi]ESS63216.1 hypothetical protein TCDM_08994 [Trypanosoma cruzi Dm28c]PBJ80071.1 hypothetical protein BCY84_02100 [Trypanosoma cruzi cruzi]KAF8278093.1 putative HMG-box domain containing protein [Trypanosoma cruzi]PWU94510.1 hypothetical protein C4B63_26g197 [Trypanosoma cruzi]
MRRYCLLSGNAQSFQGARMAQARHHINGFSLFAKEIQEKEQVLTAKNLRNGHENMRVVSRRWQQLTRGQRHLYNKRAHEIGVLKVRDNEKSFNDFNLLMRLLFRSEEMSHAGDEFFTAHMARNTLTQLKSEHKKKLREKLVPKTLRDKNKKKERALPAAWYFPQMRYFESFVEMLRSVAPTQKALFTAVSRVLAVNRIVSGDLWENLSKKFDALTEEERAKFSPITDEDAPRFERYCASHCATFDVERFDIVRLFAQYRGLVTAKTSLPEPEATQYKMLMESDRFRESLYFKALRNLERANAGRSTDQGTYISHIHPDGVNVPPKTYLIYSRMSDVEIATLLAETRYGKSVYDDVMDRAGCFRLEKANALLTGTYLAPERAIKKGVAKKTPKP